METKVCKKCGRELPVTNFSKNANNKDGLQRHCKECVSAYMKEYEIRKKECGVTPKKRKAKKLADAPVIEKIKVNELRSSYNLAKWEKDIIVDCIKSNPDKSFTHYAELLGVSERTFYRKIYQHDLRELIHDVKSFSEREMADAISGVNLTKVKTLADYEDKELLEELWKRDYDGNIWKMVRHETVISKLFGKRK